MFLKLDAVARGKQKSLETVKADHLIGMTDGDLQKLASSWGPFQIMGYKCYEIECGRGRAAGQKSGRERREVD